MSVLKRVLSIGSLAIVLIGPSLARANGRFPEANQLIFAEHDPTLVILRVTFGLLISHDRGQTFEWVCEEGIGYNGIDDPMYTVTPSDAVIGATYQGVTSTRDRGCNWSFADGELAHSEAIDLSANPDDRKNVVIFTSAYDSQDDAGQLRFVSKLWETKDEGRTFQQVGPSLDPTLLGYTIDLAKADPNRMYASVVRNPGPQPEGVLLTSKDRGESWVSAARAPFFRGEARAFMLSGHEDEADERRAVG